jgi:hypothetical protein
MADPIKQYDGEQIIISSNRLVFNSDIDNILFSTANKTHFSTKKEFLIDVGEVGSTDKNFKFHLNAPLIILGSDKLGRTLEPVVKGEAMDKLIKDIFEALYAYSQAVTASVPTSPQLKVASELLSNRLKIIVTGLNDIKSDITYTI